MKPRIARRDFFRASGAGALAAALGPEIGAAAQGVAKAPENFRLVGAPVVQAPSDTAVSIAWAVNDTSTGWVEFGETPALGQKRSAADAGLLPLDDVVHKVRITGLKPSTKYYYRVYAAPVAFLGPYDIRRGRPFASPAYSFSTLDSGRAETTFSVINDTHETPETLTALMGRLKEQPTAMTFWNGDMFNDIRSDAHLAEQLLTPAGLAYATDVPIYFTRGNHDVRGAGARHLARFIDTPSGLPYYSFREGPIAFICLDTGEDKPDDHPVYAGLGEFAAYRQQQREWLATELLKDHIRTASFRIVVAHIPMYSATTGERRPRPVDAYGGTGPSGGEDARAKWHDLLVKAQVDLIIAGHTHRYAYLEPDLARPFAQLTGGGPRPEAATLIQGQATARELIVRMTKLDGTEIGRYTFPRRT